MGTAIGFIGVNRSRKEYFLNPQKWLDLTSCEKIKEETSELLSKREGYKTKCNWREKGTDYAEIISEPVIFKGLKVENSKINPDEAISLLQDRADSVMDAKSEMLPSLINIVPK